MREEKTCRLSEILCVMYYLITNGMKLPASRYNHLLQRYGRFYEYNVENYTNFCAGKIGFTPATDGHLVLVLKMKIR